MYNFTQDDLIQYMYNETSTEKTAAIKAALAADFRLQEQFDDLSASKESLNEIKMMTPRLKSLESIFAYAEKFSLTQKNFRLGPCL